MNAILARSMRFCVQLTIIFSVLAGGAHHALGAEVVVCSKAAKFRVVRCIFKIEAEKNLRKKDQVIVYTKEQYWVATGEIVIVKNGHFIASFEPNSPIGRGFKAEVKPFGEESTLSYEGVFD